MSLRHLQADQAACAPGQAGTVRASKLGTHLWILFRQAAQGYQAYDAFARVSVAFGTHQLMLSPGTKKIIPCLGAVCSSVLFATRAYRCGWSHFALSHADVVSNHRE